MMTDSYPHFSLLPLRLGELDTNCYLIWCEHTLECLIIDPADAGDAITQQVVDLHLKPVGIVLTHGHFDHVLGLLEVKLNFNVPIWLNTADNFLLQGAPASALHWLKRRVDPVPPADKALSSGDRITFGDCYLEVLETPGHTPGSVVLFNDQVMFTGDTVFKDGVGRTDFRYSNPAQLKQSIAAIQKLSPGKILYAGHGESFSL